MFLNVILIISHIGVLAYISVRCGCSEDDDEGQTVPTVVIARDKTAQCHEMIFLLIFGLARTKRKRNAVGQMIDLNAS